MKYSTVTNLRYIDSSNHYIGCKVTFEGVGEIPFVAFKDDVEPHGKEIYDRAVNGDFGSIEAFTPPPEQIISDEEIAARIRQERNSKLIVLDSVVCNPMRWASFSDAQKQELADYRQALLDITDQNTFPQSVTWPNTPSVVPAQQVIELDSSNIVLM